MEVNKEPETVCRDLDGNAFLARSAGYKVLLAGPQPFAYCDAPALKQCQSSAVVSVFEPIASKQVELQDQELVPAELEQVPAHVLREGLHKMLSCHNQMHSRTKRCIDAYIEEQPAWALREKFVSTDVLNAALSECR